MIQFHAFDTPHAQAAALASEVGDALAQAAAAQADTYRASPGAKEAAATTLTAAAGSAPRATLAVSGGSSPRAFLIELSAQPFEWARYDVTLVDDRWVPDTDPASNARFIRETLLQNAAAAARFLPLVDVRVELDAHVAALNADPARKLPDVAVLGMGEDGHTASIFADAPEWHAALTSAAPFVAVHPGGAPHARVSWSMPALRQIGSAGRLFLLIAGERKRAVLERAVAHAEDTAISKLARTDGVTLDVYWCAE